MEITDNRIDAGKAFDWGKTSEYYAKYRDIYPEVFYSKVADRGLCIKGQNVLDLGTGTGVFARNMYKYGATWTGIDISPEQIEQAKRLSFEAKMDIEFKTVSVEKMDFPSDSFDVITACQCFFYFDHEKITPELHRILKKNGKIIILYMAWLPYEDKIAGESEKIVLKYNPDWTGKGETKHPIQIPSVMNEYFNLEESEEYELKVPFTRNSWHGRMIACRGVGASLSPEEFARWDIEHREFLNTVPESFDVQHYAAVAILKRRN